MAVELLAPAGNIEIGRSAILSGADAIYIGAPDFGARKAAGNSMDDIARLLDFAHLFGVRVYLTMNTILYDRELERAESMARRAEELGVDALIVQDMAYQKMGLHRIPLHASTQTFNFDLDKICLVAASGFDRIVLERSLTLEEIRRIHEAIPIEIETFVHGAMCVGFSGRCYLSQYLSGRSGNRGVCAQACRNDYYLTDSDGHHIADHAPLLSVSDIDFSDRICQLVAAGVTSLKIEGRLKDEQYVVNNVAYYSSLLNKLGIERTSRGEHVCNFTPNPRKSFSRGTAGHMFLDNPRAKVGASTKSLGEPIAKVTSISGDRITISPSDIILHNGDGVCWPEGGAYINGVRGGSLLLSSTIGLKAGGMIYRNFDKEFLPSSRDVDRYIPVDITIEKRDDWLYVSTDGFCMNFPIGNNPALNQDLARDNILAAFSKVGDSNVRVRTINLNMEDIPFVRISQLNAIRRDFLAGCTSHFLSKYTFPIRTNYPAADLQFPCSLSYEWNVSNRLAAEFYKEHGVNCIEPALETQSSIKGKTLMISRHCIRRQLGICPKDNPGSGPAKPLILENNGRKLNVEFDCSRCLMHILAPSFE